MTLEVLYVDDCPGHRQLLAPLGALAGTYGTTLVQTRVASEEQARRLRFLGSPTVRVEGRDVERAARDRTDFGLRCRLYRSPAGQSGAPPLEWIEAALRAGACS